MNNFESMFTEQRNNLNGSEVDFGMEADDEASVVTMDDLVTDSQIHDISYNEVMDQLDLSNLSINDYEEINLGNMSDSDIERRSASASTQSSIVPFPDKHYYWMNDEKTIKFIKENFEPSAFYIMHNGKIVEDFDEFIETYKGQHLVRFTFHFRLRGGKGGFGSLLRSFRVNKSTNKLMMRDLNGRRLASVDEEGRLKRYLERQARKEEELRQKRKAKLEKLTAGPPKHKFEDQEYLAKREEIIENTEDACEAGFAYLKELRKKQKKQTKSEDEENKDKNDSDEEVLDVDDLFNERGGRKRKIEGPKMDEDEEKMKKMRKYEENSSDSEDDSENEPDAEELQALREYFQIDQNIKNQQIEEGQGSSKDSDDKQVNIEQQVNEVVEKKNEPVTNNVDDIPKIDDKKPCTYDPVNLDEFVSAQDLELLGLEHLKSALNDRGLKGGGTLEERAKRLWSVKGLEQSSYPKHILTPEMKKKLAEEELKNKKKQKKSKK